MNTVFAGHIEKPEYPFVVSFNHPGYFNVFWHPAEKRYINVLAETKEGALKVAEYHYYTGSNFEVIQKGVSPY